MRPSFADHLDMDRLQAAQDGFAHRTGLALITVNAAGQPVTDPSRFTAFCAIMRSHPDHRKLCESCDAHGGLQAMVEGRPAAYRCHAGLVDFSVPILRDGAYLGAVLCGQLRPDDTAPPPHLTGTRGAWRSDPHMVRMFNTIPKLAPEDLDAHTQHLAQLVDDILQQHNTSRPSPSLRIAVHQPPDDGLSALTAQPARALELATARNDLTAQSKAVHTALEAIFRNTPGRISPSLLQPLEDAIILGTSGDTQLAGIMRHEVMRLRSQQRIALSQSQCQYRLERLLYLHHDEAIRRTHETHSFPDLLNYIERTINRPISLQQAADFLNVTAPHMSRIFKARTGVNFSTYVAEKRISRAQLLLRGSDLPVARIARELGFNPPNYFTRLFKKVTGITPTEYRQQCRAAEKVQ